MKDFLHYIKARPYAFVMAMIFNIILYMNDVYSIVIFFGVILIMFGFYSMRYATYIEKGIKYYSITKKK